MQNKKKINKSLLKGVLLTLAFSACTQQWDGEYLHPNQGEEITLLGSINQQNETRANDDGFADGDRMGIYIVDYEEDIPGSLSATDNRASNVLYTYYAFENCWKSATTLYWKDGTTPADFYGYYPGVNYIESPSAYRFEVSNLQNADPAEGEMSNYEASDFLWGKMTNVTPTTETVTITYTHRMAGVKVQLKMGKGFNSQTEWDNLGKLVQIDNTIRTATIDLGTGKPVPTGSVDKSILMLPQSDGVYRAVVVPQTVDSNKTLMTITIDGYSYTYQLNEAMTYESGKLHNFEITVNKSDNAEGYVLSFANNGITAWENDESSHNFDVMKYVVINCTDPGTLQTCISDAGYKYAEMQNLKVTGTLTQSDFEFMNKQMSALTHLNLKEIEIKDVHIYKDKSIEVEKNHWEWFTRKMDNAIPEKAFYQNKNIRSIVLPKQMTHIGDNAFRESNLMYSALEIPEGVTYIGNHAFAYTGGTNGVELVLPITIDSIDNGAFLDCAYRCDFKLNDNIKYLGSNAFERTPNFYGVFAIPSKLKTINDGVFYALGSNKSFTGSIEIPQGVTEIGASGFRDISFSDRLSLTFPQGVKSVGQAAFVGARLNSLHFNDDLEEIGREAFYNTNIPFQITLPSQLEVLGYRAFLESGVEGELVIPESCLTIAEGVFGGNNITKVSMPQRLEMISDACFSNNRLLKEVTISKYVNYIGKEAFADDVALQTIICLNPEPPALGSDVFRNVPMDKVILQVPEQSVGLYRNTSGWKEFKNITAYHELAFNIPEIIALNKGMTRQGILRTEGKWEISQCPDWVTVTPKTGDAKAEVTITVEENAAEGNREGQIVFSLKDENYTACTTVKQISSSVYKEDEQKILQEASAGASKVIPLFIVGDGYNAEEIVSGKYLEDMKEQMNYLFSIEPFKTYKDYFTVSTAYACSPESGIDGETKFESENYDGLHGNSEKVWQYALKNGKGFSTEREADCTILVLLNTNSTANQTDIADNGRTVSWVGKSSESYPFDQKSQVLREVGGVAFGKLGPEGIDHFTFMKACTCPGCNMLNTYHYMSSKGWYRNVSVSARISDLPWYQYMFHKQYAVCDVDIYEGALHHARGTYRSENVSIMGNTFIPYFNTISRETIVRRIMQCAGKEFSIEDFIANDKIEIPQ